MCNLSIHLFSMVASTVLGYSLEEFQYGVTSNFVSDFFFLLAESEAR